MEEHYPKIKISELYSLFKLISEIQNEVILDPKILEEDIKDSNTYIENDFRKFNNEYMEIIQSINKGQWDDVNKWLFVIRATIMGIASDFDNLRKDIEVVCDAIEKKQSGKVFTWKKLD